MTIPDLLPRIDVTFSWLASRRLSLLHFDIGPIYIVFERTNTVYGRPHINTGFTVPNSTLIYLCSEEIGMEYDRNFNSNFKSHFCRHNLVLKRYRTIRRVI